MRREGVTQGDILAMILYSISIIDLVEDVHTDVPTACVPAHVDNLAAMGHPAAAETVLLALQHCSVKGYRYFPEPEKSIVI